MELPEGIPEDMRAMIESGEAELVNGGEEMSPHDLLAFALQQVDAEVATQMLVARVAALRAEHAVHSDCDCTPDIAWDGGFEVWDEIVADAKARVKPLYDEYVEQHIFAVDVKNGLDEIDVAEPVRPGDEEL